MKIIGDMGFLEKLAAFFEPPLPVKYECANCGRHFETDQAVCPDCGADIDPADVDESFDGYWGSMH